MQENYNPVSGPSATPSEPVTLGVVLRGRWRPEIDNPYPTPLDVVAEETAEREAIAGTPPLFYSHEVLGDWQEEREALRLAAREKTQSDMAAGEAKAGWQGDPNSNPQPGRVASLRFRTGRDLAETTSKRIDWIAEPLLVRGSLTEVVGKIKIAGKTTFALALCRAGLDGSPFLGYPTVKGAVVYLTEQTDASFRFAAEKAGVLGREDFVFLSWHDRAATWKATVEAAVAKAREIGAALVVVDTLSRWAGIKEENDAGPAMEAYAPLKDAAGKYEIAFLCLRHARKGGGDIGEAGRGSSAFAGDADILADLRRLEKKQASPNMRALEILGRFGALEILVELTPDGYRNAGSREDVIAEAVGPRLLEAAPASEDAAMTADQIREEANRDESGLPIAKAAATMALGRLVKREELHRSGKGKKGDPFRYWR